MAASTSCTDEYVTKPKPLDLLVLGSLMTYIERGLHQSPMSPPRKIKCMQKVKIQCTYHTVCKAPPLLEVGPQAFICGLEAQASDEQLAELFRLTWDLHNGQSNTHTHTSINTLASTSVQRSTSCSEQYHNKPPQHQQRADRFVIDTALRHRSNTGAVEETSPPLTSADCRVFVEWLQQRLHANSKTHCQIM